MADATAQLNYAHDSLDTRSFIDCELKNFSNSQAYDLLPNLNDGLKVVQRKILYLARRKKAEFKVPALSGLLVTDAAYHHGDVSSQAAILHMAACYPTSNNLPLLVAHGATGSRLGSSTTSNPSKTYKDFKVGYDASAPRYVSVSPSDVLTYLFRKEDDILLHFTPIDGDVAEPDCFSPVLPLGIINGAEAIATGHASSIPGHDPLSILYAVRERVKSGSWPVAIKPSYKGFTGTLELAKLEENQGWTCSGAFTQEGTKITVTEIPIGTSILGYKAWLDHFDDDRFKKVVNTSHSNRPMFTFEYTGGDATLKSLNLVEHVAVQYKFLDGKQIVEFDTCLLYTSPSPRD
jgi:DNA topoisomerase-2